MSHAARPRLEVLEDRCVLALSAFNAAQLGMATVNNNPGLFNANALLGNQLMDQFALLPTVATPVANQFLIATVQSSIQQAGFSPDPNAPQEASQLLNQEAFLARDLALIVINPGITSDPTFVGSIEGAAAAITTNPWFFTPAGFTEALGVAGVFLNQQLFGSVTFA